MKRQTSLDLIRSIAVFFVVSVHFFLNTHFYQMTIDGPIYIIPIFFRTLFFTCVPLFLLLTGYLQNKKELSKKYYKGIKKIIISYLFISIICLFFNRYYLNQHGLAKGIIGIFNFKTDGYSWYIEMYLGLFLLIPFLNVLYKNLKSKKEKQALIITLLALVSFAPVFNYLKYKDLFLYLIPDYWTLIYPLIYYFIGCYISEYKIKIDKKKGLIALLGILLITTISLYTYSTNQVFSWSFLGTYGGITTVISSTLIFLLLYDIKIKESFTSKIIQNISILSLDIYLFSYISDKILYKTITIPDDIHKYFILYFMTVPLTFTAAWLMSYLKSSFFKLLAKIKPIDKIIN